MRILFTALFTLITLYSQAQNIFVRELDYDDPVKALDAIKYNDQNLVLLQNLSADTSLNLVYYNNSFGIVDELNLLSSRNSGAALTYLADSTELHVFYSEITNNGTTIHELTDTNFISSFNVVKSYEIANTNLNLLGAVSTLTDQYLLLKEQQKFSFTLMHITDSNSTSYPLVLPDELEFVVNDFEWDPASGSKYPYFLIVGDIDSNGIVMEFNDSANLEFRNFYVGNRQTSIKDLSIIDNQYYLAGGTNSYLNTTYDALLMEVDEWGNKLEEDTYNIGGAETYYAMTGINDTSIILSGYSSSGLPFVRIINTEYKVQHSWTNLKDKISGGTFDIMHHDTISDVILLAGTNNDNNLLIGLVGDDIPLEINTVQPMMENITVYPNPANNYFSVHTPGNQLPVKVQLFNTAGVLVFEGQNDENYFELPGLKNGLYIVKITGNNKVGTEILMINK